MLTQLSSHYWRPDFSSAQYRALIKDFISDLAPYSLEKIAAAIEAYRRAPENKFFPHPGALIGFMREPEHLVRRALTTFTASQHSAPEAATSLKPWKEVLAKHRR